MHSAQSFTDLCEVFYVFYGSPRVDDVINVDIAELSNEGLQRPDSLFTETRLKSFRPNGSQLYSYSMSNGIFKDVYFMYSSCYGTCQKLFHKLMRKSILQLPVSLVMASIRGIANGNRWVCWLIIL